MRMSDIIEKKRDGFELNKEELYFFIEGYVNGTIPDYQASALMMAIYFRDLSENEINHLTAAMAQSGDTVNLSDIKTPTCDKHSTGGVGDKTSLIVAPIVASLGGSVAKMSGRGLGHTGGTLDKLESIPGFNITLDTTQFITQVNDIGIAVIGQSGNLAPADKMLYALRDVTATVENIGLIASSIMSKKLAAGAQCIVLDVKCGSGAFMKTKQDAEKLAGCMVKIGKSADRKIAAVISSMDTPLGKNIGNTLEVKEAIEVLNARGCDDLRQVSVCLAANLLSLAFNKDLNECTAMAEQSLIDGSALNKFAEMVRAQGGDESYILKPEKFSTAKNIYSLRSPHSGYIASMNAQKIGHCSVILGAGRAKKDDKIDPAAGIILHKKTGDYVEKGEIIAELHSSKDDLAQGEAIFLSSLSFSETSVEKEELVMGIVK